MVEEAEAKLGSVDNHCHQSLRRVPCDGRRDLEAVPAAFWDAMTNEQLLESLQPSAATVEAVRPRSPDPGAGFAKASRQLGGDQRRAWERTGRV
jgi:hypothetical protein